MVSAMAPWSETDLLRLAASVERGSEHPVANAIVGELKRAPSRWSRRSSLPQRREGVMATVGGRRVAVGTIDWLQG